jgi:hypothetical protein
MMKYVKNTLQSKLKYLEDEVHNYIIILSIRLNRVLFILPKKVMTLKLADRLLNDDKRKLTDVKSPKKEVLSRKELEELMGKNRDTYKRVGGAVRRK